MKTQIILVIIFYCTNLFSNLFITKGSFEQIADHAYCPETGPNDFLVKDNLLTDPALVKTSDIIFIRSSCLDHFIQNMHPKIENPYIIISHVDDDPINHKYLNFLNDPKIISWFAIQNEILNHDKMFSIPIGVFQPKSIWQNKEKINNIFAELRNVPKTKMLYLNFSDFSNPERPVIRQLFSGLSYCYSSKLNIKEHYVDKPNHDVVLTAFLNYINEMAHFKFVFSPRGFAQDCYRTWEAILVGTIPIVKSSNLNVLYENLPILVVKDWQEINEMFLMKKYKEIKSKHYDLDKLYISFWENKIKSVKENYLIKK